jgi:Uma2 family endonuclease
MSTKAAMTVEQFAPLSRGTYRHKKIRDLIGHLLWIYFRQNPIGEAVGENDCQVAPEEVRRPDISIFLGERLRQIDPDKIPAPFAPDIAIEVLSPSDGAVDLRRKVRDYLRGGSREVWLLDHSNAEVQVYTNVGLRILQSADVLESSLLPGFSARVAEFVLAS